MVGEGGTTSPWYVSFFDQEYFDIYGALLSDERTIRERRGHREAPGPPAG